MGSVLRMTRWWHTFLILPQLVLSKTPYKFDYLYDDTLSYSSVKGQFLDDARFICTKGRQVVERKINPLDVINSEERVIFDRGCDVSLGWSNIDAGQFTCINGVNPGFAGPYGDTVNVTIWIQYHNSNNTGYAFEFNFDKCSNIAWKSGEEFYVVSDSNVIRTKVDSSGMSVQNFLTHDGAFDEIFYGSNDWMNGVSKTMFVQNDSLIVTRADMRGVKWFEFQKYESSDGIYPPMAKMRYPNPGTANPVWEILRFDSTNNQVQSISNPLGDDGYLQQVIPGDSNEFFASWKNRWSNESTLIKYNFDGSSQEIDSFKNPSGWVGVTNNEEYFTKGGQYLYSNRPYNGFNQLYRLPVDPESAPNQFLSSGNYEISDMSNYDPIACAANDDSNVYYYSTLHVDGKAYQNKRFLWRLEFPSERHTCLTCDLPRCSDVDVISSPTCRMQVWNCAGNGNEIPMSYFYDQDSKNITPVIHNQETVDRLEDIEFRNKQYYYNQSIPEIGPEGFNYQLHFPPNFDDTKSYPVLVWVYGGPGTAWVTDYWKNEWANEYIASSQDVIVASLDSYGTPGRGTDFLYKVYKQLGYYEPLNQISFARHLGQTYKFINPDKIAVWGRSYGGFVTSRIMSADSEAVFKCGIIVAAVTDWNFYQTLYTERAMLSPQLNPEGYANSVSWQKSENYKKHHVYMAHGTHDENVHFQNSAFLERWLVSEGVEFESYFAADENHRFTRTKNGNQL